MYKFVKRNCIALLLNYVINYQILNLHVRKLSFIKKLNKELHGL